MSEIILKPYTCAFNADREIQRPSCGEREGRKGRVGEADSAAPNREERERKRFGSTAFTFCHLPSTWLFVGFLLGRSLCPDALLHEPVQGTLQHPTFPRCASGLVPDLRKIERFHVELEMPRLTDRLPLYQSHTHALTLTHTRTHAFRTQPTLPHPHSTPAI